MGAAVWAAAPLSQRAARSDSIVTTGSAVPVAGLKRSVSCTAFVHEQISDPGIVTADAGTGIRRAAAAASRVGVGPGKFRSVAPA